MKKFRRSYTNLTNKLLKFNNGKSQIQIKNLILTCKKLKPQCQKKLKDQLKK